MQESTSDPRSPDTIAEDSTILPCRAVESRDHSAVRAAILQAVAYADIFDYPLTSAEVHRYLIGVRASPADVEAALDNREALSGRMTRVDGYFTLAGREGLVKTRLRRASAAARIWRPAARYGRIIAAVPFVRMVAATGALALDNVEADTDIDYLVVVEPGRLWLCRAMVILVKKLASTRGDSVCPNYFLSERALALPERTLFTAHELVQMVPIYGLATYRRMCQVNAWATRFLPNADLPPRRDILFQVSGLSKENRAAGLRCAPRALAEGALRTRGGAWLERWEMLRKIRKLSSPSGMPPGWQSYTVENGRLETSFSPDWCKGHFFNHGQRTLAAFVERLRALDVAPPPLVDSAGIGDTPPGERS